jgi:hypothetical protein
MAYCLHCDSELHPSNACPQKREVQAEALKKKKKTYADALRKSSPQPLRIAPRPGGRKFIDSVRFLIAFIFREFNIQADVHQALDQALSALNTINANPIPVSTPTPTPNPVASTPTVSCEIKDGEEVKSTSDGMDVSSHSCEESDPGASSDDSISRPVKRRTKEAAREKPPYCRDITCSCGSPVGTCVVKLSKDHFITCPCGATFTSRRNYFTHAKSCSSVSHHE